MKAMKRLMGEVPRGMPLDSEQLSEVGISLALASYLERNEWLQRLSNGVYIMRGDEPTAEGIIAYLGRRIPGLHVGGETALKWRDGFIHPKKGEVISLWGDRRYELPSWVSIYMNTRFQSTQLFQEGFKENCGLKRLPNSNYGVSVSTPERALLEIASDIGKSYSSEQARQVVAGIDDHEVKAALLAQCLGSCKRVKVVRLVRDMCRSTGLPWSDVLQDKVDQLGGGKRWSNRTKTGERLTLAP